MLNVAEIDLVALEENAFNIRKKLGGALFNAVVKADAYGHGAAVIANALYPFVDQFSVAVAEEGVALRLAGIDKPILVLNEPFAADVPLFARYDLTATVASAETVRRLASADRPVRAHIKVNTGMNRQGASLGELDKIFCAFTDHPAVVPAGIYSHLRAPEDERIFKMQLDEFLLAYRAAKGYNKNMIAHIAASGGFLKGAYFDMCRIGLLLYGYKPFPSDEISVRPLMRVYAPTLATRRLHRGDGLLYGRDVLDGDAEISLVRYGYADGLPRARGELPAERCMDVSAYCGKKDKFAVLDGDADRLAAIYHTVPYEILCHAAKRANKIYLR